MAAAVSSHHVEHDTQPLAERREVRSAATHEHGGQAEQHRQMRQKEEGAADAEEYGTVPPRFDTDIVVLRIVDHRATRERHRRPMATTRRRSDRIGHDRIGIDSRVRRERRRVVDASSRMPTTSRPCRMRNIGVEIIFRLATFPSFG